MDESLEMPSVLETIKEELGITKQDTAFDRELIVHINSVFAILYQLGVGTDKPFKISGYDERWSEFIDQNDTEFVKSYMYLKVRLLFDPPQTATMYDAIVKQSQELEWRLNVASEQQDYPESD